MLPALSSLVRRDGLWDVVHSTDIASAVGAERLPEIKAALVDHVVVERHGGRSTRSPTGDEMMAVLGGRPRSAQALTTPGTLCQCTMQLVTLVPSRSRPAPLR